MMIRRIRRSEHDELSTLCRNDKRWSQYYYSHNIWLEKALKDVSSKDRVVFGVFDSKDDADNSEHTLIACIFLKRSQFDNSIEFKNLILPENDGATNTSNLAQKLVEKTIIFCEVRNIQKIEMELPQDEHPLISIFLSLNFKIVALRERYHPGNVVCVLERTIGDNYQGDPFDSKKFAYWLLRCYMPCEVKKNEIIENNLLRIYFEGKTNSKAFSKENKIGFNKRLKGSLWILEDFESFDSEFLIICKYIKYGEPIIILVFSELINEQAKQKTSAKGITLIDRSDALVIAGNLSSSLSVPIEIQDIGGIITVLEHEQIVNYSKLSSLTYYLLSGIQNGLNISDEVSSLLVIYSPNWNSKGRGIAGFSEINKVDRIKFNELISKPLPDNSALTSEDLGFYQTYSDDERIAVLTCSRLTLFENPLKIGDRESEWMPNLDVKDYLQKELIKNSNNSVYVDLQTTSKIKEMALLVPKYTPLTFTVKKKFRVGLSFAGEGRAFISHVADLLMEKLGRESVFYDKYYEAELARPDLDIYISNIYRNQCDLIVPFFSTDYKEKKWCKLEWRTIRDILTNSKEKGVLMPFKFDEIEVEGLLSIDGYSLIGTRKPEEVTELILKRIAL